MVESDHMIFSEKSEALGTRFVFLRVEDGCVVGQIKCPDGLCMQLKRTCGHVCVLHASQTAPNSGNMGSRKRRRVLSKKQKDVIANTTKRVFKKPAKKNGQQGQKNGQQVKKKQKQTQKNEQQVKKKQKQTQKKKKRTKATDKDVTPTPETPATDKDVTPAPETPATDKDVTPASKTPATDKDSTPAPETPATDKDDTTASKTPATDKDDTPAPKTPATDKYSTALQEFMFARGDLSGDSDDEAAPAPAAAKAPAPAPAAVPAAESRPYTEVMFAADNDTLPPDPTHASVVVATRIANNIAAEYNQKDPPAPKPVVDANRLANKQVPPAPKPFVSYYLLAQAKKATWIHSNEVIQYMQDHLAGTAFGNPEKWTVRRLLSMLMDKYSVHHKKGDNTLNLGRTLDFFIANGNVDTTATISKKNSKKVRSP